MFKIKLIINDGKTINALDCCFVRASVRSLQFAGCLQGMRLDGTHLDAGV